MTEDVTKMNLYQLMQFVRKHQIYQGEVAKGNPLAYKSISDWLVDSNITPGPFPVKGSAFYNLYRTWCEQKQLDNSLIVKSKTFHSTLTNEFGASRDRANRNTTYYINKKVVYEPRKKKKDQAASSTTKKEQEKGKTS